jgi:N-acyl-D-amino-acid deacylase
MAAVEGFSPAVLEAGLPWTWDSVPSYLDSLEGRIGVNAATYVAHSAVRRFVMGDRASSLAATNDELAAMVALVHTARAAGACGFSTERMGAELDHLGKPTPSVIADESELHKLIRAAGATPHGSIAVLPRSVGEGLTDDDANLLTGYTTASRLPVIIQGIGWRPGLDAQWNHDQVFLDASTRAGSAIYSIYRNHPMVRPFDWVRGTSLFKGVEHWRDFPGLSERELSERVASPEWRVRLAESLDHPITDPTLGATTPPPPMDTVFVERSSIAGAEGKSVAELAGERNQHAAEVICDLLAADSLTTGFAWRSETAKWRRGTAETLRHPNILVGTGDGGAHADRDDGSEWSTYFLSKWVRDAELFTLEEGVRRITSVPARVCGLHDRGVIAPGFGADLVLVDLEHLELGTKSIVQDLPAHGERWRAEVEGIEQVIVNGRPIVKSNKITGQLPGAVLRTRASTN